MLQQGREIDIYMFNQLIGILALHNYYFSALVFKRQHLAVSTQKGLTFHLLASISSAGKSQGTAGINCLGKRAANKFHQTSPQCFYYSLNYGSIYPLRVLSFLRSLGSFSDPPSHSTSLSTIFTVASLPPFYDKHIPRRFQFLH